MATILDKLSPQAELGERLGGSLSSGLRSLVDSKLARIQRQTGLSALVDPKQAEALSYLPEEMVQKLMPQLMKNQQMQQGLAAFSPQGIQQPGDGQLDQLAPSQQPTSQEFQPSMVNQGFTPGQQLEQQVRQQSGQPLMQQPQLAPQGLPQGQQPAAPSQGLSKSQRIAQEDAAALEAGKRAMFITGKPAEALKAQQDVKKTMQRERIEEAKISTQERKEQATEQRAIDKENKDFITDINNKAKSSDEDDRRLKRMEVLIDKGDLTRPRFSSLLDTISTGIFGFGIDLHSIETADSQEFTKLSNEFVKGAKEIFSNRITDADLKIFMKMVPTLAMTRDGKRRVIHNMQLYNEGNKIRKKAMNDLVKSNKGLTPRNLELLTEEKIEKQLDELANRFEKGLVEKLKPKKEPLGIFEVDENPVTSFLDSFLGQG